MTQRDATTTGTTQPEHEVELVPTEDDARVWEDVYGFTPQEIGIMARYVEVPEEKVTRLIELARFIRTLPKQEVQS